MARANSPPIPRSESKTPRKRPKCPPLGVNTPKIGQTSVNLEKYPKCWKIIGNCSEPIGKQLRQSPHPNLWQEPSPRQSRDVSQNTLKLAQMPSPGGNRAQKWVKTPEKLEIFAKCVGKTSGNVHTQKGNQFIQSAHPNLLEKNNSPPIPKSESQSKNGPNGPKMALPRL